jgi:hypothetical protein
MMLLHCGKGRELMTRSVQSEVKDDDQINHDPCLVANHAQLFAHGDDGS